jgi:predicted phage-related endonuclease
VRYLIDKIMINISKEPQGSEQWIQERCGLLTASEMHLILTPTLKPAKNDKQRAHLYELVAQRITKFVEPRYISDDMLRGQFDEMTARNLYSDRVAQVNECGLITNDKFGFKIGYSPDGLIANDGLIEVKSRRQKYQIETISSNQIPDQYILQIQTGLLVSERDWCDFVSFSGGLPLCILRAYPDTHIQAAIVDAATEFEWFAKKQIEIYSKRLGEMKHVINTERQLNIESEIIL